MRVIIAGSRNASAGAADALVEHAIDQARWLIHEVVSGAARGIDQAGERWARKNGIPIIRFPADWKKHGKAAGPIRNRQMAEYVGEIGGLIAIQIDRSRGTADMIRQAEERSLAVYVLEVTSEEVTHIWEP